MYYLLKLLWLVTLVAAKSPTGGYAPGFVQCPTSNSSFIREANSISHQEKKWLEGRQPITNKALVSFLKLSNLTSFDAEKFINHEHGNSSISIALAFSGGGYRAMLSGAGQLAGLDSRTDYSEGQNGLGGLLESATYISALSGGSWMLTSLLFNNFSSVQDIVLQNDHDLWNLTETRQLVNESGTWSLYWDVATTNLEGALSHMNNFGIPSSKRGIGYDIDSKVDAGFNVSLTDYWGRGLSYQLFTKDLNYSRATSFSDLRDADQFKNYEIPFPLVISLGRKPGTIVYNLNSTVFEFNPYELGSFDTSLNTFTDLKYIGTNVTNGVPDNNKKCVQGFDNAGFVTGTSSSLFNQFLNTLVCDDCNSLNFAVKWVLKYFLNKLSNDKEDIAQYTPNPFYKSEYASSNNITTDETLYLFDGGLGGEVIPLSSVLTKERAVDIAFAFDNGNDLSQNWPNGSALISTYERQFLSNGKSVVCPYVPNAETFLENNLTTRPTFFGCNSSNLTELAKDGVLPPIVVYIANRPYEFMSNTSTFKLSYTDAEKKAMIQNGIDVSTRLNGTIDDEYRTCIACAVIRREEERRNITQSEQCKKCFSNYCWDGSLAKVKTPYYAKVNYGADSMTNGTDLQGLKPPKTDPTNKLWSLISIRDVQENAGDSLLPSISVLFIAIMMSVFV